MGETEQAPAVTDVVWIRASAEVNYAGVEPVEDYVSIPRAEWDAMTEQEREDELQQAAAGALEQLASSGASVVAADEVPDEYLRE